MNTPASAVVPSREAVENIIREKHLGSLDNTCTKCGTTVADMLRTLLAEVERLTETERLLKISLDKRRELCAEAVRELRATVAEQGAALAERDKDREAMTAYLEALRVTLGMQHEARDGLAKKILARIAALASAQSQENKR
jgi:lipoate-protein ligase A